MPTTTTQIDHDLSRLSRNEVESLYIAAFDLLGKEKVKVKALHHAANEAIHALKQIDNMLAKYSVNLLTKAIKSNPI